MLVTIHFSLFILLIIISLSFICLTLLLSYKNARLRLKINQLLEAKAKAIDEADYYAELAQNPLGPLFSKNTEPLILSFDTKGKIIDVNTNLLQKFGYNKAQLIGKNAVGTILPIPHKETESMIYRLFKNPNLFIDAETEAMTKKGEKIWISWTNKVVYNSKGKAVSADAVGFDVTKRKEMEAELQYLSSIDPQTGVMNRPALLETGTTELKRAKRYKRDLSVAVFKLAHGKNNIPVTDEQLKTVTKLARDVVRSVDYLGRIGDVEFALILPETVPQNVPFLFKRLGEHLNEYNDANKTKLTISYATAAFTKKSDTIDSLLNHAWRKVNLKKK